MKKYGFQFVIIVITIIFSASFAYSEIAKEGSGVYRSGKSGTFEVLKMAEGQIQMNWSEKGAYVVAPENSPLQNASFHAIGTLYAFKKKFSSSGSVVITCQNGDKIFGKIKGVEGVLGTGPQKGEVELTGGTGGCEGITGNIEIMQNPQVKNSAKGSYQGISVGKITWKLADKKN